MTHPDPQPQQLDTATKNGHSGGCSFKKPCHARESKFPATGRSMTVTSTVSPRRQVLARSTACSATSPTSYPVAGPRRSFTPRVLPCTTPRNSTARTPSGRKSPSRKTDSASAERTRSVHCARLDFRGVLNPLRLFAFVAAVKYPGRRPLAVSVSTFAKSLPAARAAIRKTCRFFYGSALKGIRG